MNPRALALLALLFSAPAAAGDADDIRNAEQMLIGEPDLERYAPTKEITALIAALEGLDGPRSLLWPHAVALAGWMEPGHQRYLVRDVRADPGAPVEARAEFERWIFREFCNPRLDQPSNGWKVLPFEVGDARLEALARDLATRVADPGALPLDVHLRASADAFALWSSCLRPARPRESSEWHGGPWRAEDRAVWRGALRREIRKRKGEEWDAAKDAAERAWRAARRPTEGDPLSDLEDNGDIEGAFTRGLEAAVLGDLPRPALGWDADDPQAFYVGFDRNVATLKAHADEMRRLRAIPRPASVASMVDLAEVLHGRVVPRGEGSAQGVYRRYFGEAVKALRSAADTAALPRSAAVLAWLADLDADRARPVVDGIYRPGGSFSCGVHVEHVEDPAGRPRLTIAADRRDWALDVVVVERTERQVIETYREVTVAGNAEEPPPAPSGLDPVTRLNRILALEREGRDRQEAIWRADAAYAEAASVTASTSTQWDIRNRGVREAAAGVQAAEDRYSSASSELDQLLAEHREYAKWAEAAAPRTVYVPVYGTEVVEKKRGTQRFSMDVDARLAWDGAERSTRFALDFRYELDDPEKLVGWEVTADRIVCEAARRVGLGDASRRDLTARVAALGAPPPGPESAAAAFARAPSEETLAAFLAAMESVGR